RLEIEENLVGTERLLEDIGLEERPWLQPARAVAKEPLVHLPFLAAHQGVEVPGGRGLAGDRRPLRSVRHGPHYRFLHRRPKLRSPCIAQRLRSRSPLGPRPAPRPNSAPGATALP